MKNSIIQSLLCHSPSRNVNDKGDNTSPISEMVENDNLNNNYDNLFDKAVMIILLILKRICLIKLLMIILLILKRMIMKRIKIVVNLQNIKMLQLERKRKRKKIIVKNQITATTVIITNIAKTIITTELITVIEVRHPLIQKRLFLFWVLVWSKKIMVFTLQKTLNTSFQLQSNHLSQPKPDACMITQNLQLGN